MHHTHESPDTHSALTRRPRSDVSLDVSASRELVNLAIRQPTVTREVSGERVTIHLAPIMRSATSSIATVVHEEHLLDSLNHLLDEIVAGSAQEIVVDMASIDFVSQEALVPLVTCQKKLRTKGRSLRIMNASPGTMEKLQILKFHTIFEASGRDAQQEIPDTVDS